MQLMGLGFLLLTLLCCTEAANAKNGQNLMTWLRSMRAKRQDNSLTSDRVWSLADAIPGVPDTDYPIFSEIPDTDFSCDGRPEGYYADIAARCQVFRVCANTANNTSKGFGFLCPNGTLFNQEFFVCDWYRNVICENSENFYGLNDLIGKPMSSFSNKEVMNSARDIIMFPKKTSTYNPNMNSAMYSNYPTQLGSPLGIPGRNSVPSRGSLNLGQPTAGVGNYPSSPSSSFNPLAPSGVLPQRGANGGTVYVNSLGQLSTDDPSSFDPQRSFILRTDKDSTFDQDIRIPSNSFDTLKGIGNSYSFGIPGSNNAPIRGSADLSEPVDPSEYLNAQDRYLPPQNRKQIYTYPHDAQSQGLNGLQPILPEHTGQINTQLTAQSPKFQAPQVYGPAATQTNPSPQNSYQQPRLPVQLSPQGFQPGPSSQSNFQQGSSQPNFQGQSRFQPSNPNQPQQQQQPTRLYQQPHQTVNQQQKSYQPVQNQQNQPLRLFQQSQQNLQQPQPFRPQNQQQQIERRIDNVPQTRGGFQNGQRNQQQYNQQQPQQQYQQPQSQLRSGSNGNKQGRNEYLRNFLKDKTHIHHDKMQLVELIQRLFVPSPTRVVSADVQQSQGESFSFTYDDEQGTPSSSNSNYQSVHQHSGTCGHHQGY